MRKVIISAIAVSSGYMECPVSLPLPFSLLRSLPCSCVGGLFWLASAISLGHISRGTAAANWPVAERSAPAHIDCPASCPFSRPLPWSLPCSCAGGLFRLALAISLGHGCDTGGGITAPSR